MTDMRGRLTYSVGNEHNPTNPFGRTTLTVEQDRTARLERVRFGQQQTWTDVVEAATLDRLAAALERAGFPEVSRQPLVPDATVCSIGIEADGTQQVAQLELYASKTLPGYGEALQVLEEIVRTLSSRPR
jgi:hypothetical protein